MRRLLIANRGEIARRVMRTCRAMGIETVAVFSDADAGAPFVREADAAVALGGASPADSYLRIESILDAARRTGADAVHPGYGFLAENAGFARAVIDAGLTWVGPSPDAIEKMGSKVEAKRMMREAGVPVLPDGEASDVGFPLLVKASAGGGGKGMRVVRSAGDLDAAVEAAKREAASAFGDDTVFLERYVESPRHVEIQIFGDGAGRVVHLGERECSIQRRHQKIVEESPSVAVDEALRSRMGDAAVAAGEALGYVGAGTVEFLLAPESEEFFFLEVNTRLQVEHPVTEAVLGLDLVRLQIEIAGGGTLPETIPAPSGHAIEVRLYAEDAEHDFLPVAGALSRFRIDGDVRVDSGVEDGSEVTVHYDPMLAKVIAHAPTREEAAARLARALRGAELHGLRNNRELLVRILEHPEFLAGRTDTHFLERHDPAQLGRPLLEPGASARHAAAAALAAAAGRRSSAAVLGGLPSGWRNNPSADQEITLGAHTVRYRFDRSGGPAALAVDGEPLAEPRLFSATPSLVDLQVDGVRRTYRVAFDGATHRVNTSEGQATLPEAPRFPSAEDDVLAGSLVSPMPGAVLRVSAAAGDEVTAGQVLVIIEAMKMEQEIVAPADGVVTEVRVAVGAQVEAGAILAVLDNTA
jgi:propionyl-CoA carboxylase alpha chain